MANRGIPANETWLGQSHWTNATLDVSPGNEWTAIGNASQPTNLTVFPDNVAAIQFLATANQHHSMIFSLVRMLLSPDYYSGNLPCIYPVSGTYDFLTRLLFYLLLVFALLFRRHPWISAAALGTAMTYSATVAVHAFALLAQFGWHVRRGSMVTSQPQGDIDIQGAYPILTASLVMAPPILNWSTSIRRHRAHIIVVLWGLLSFAAWAPVTVFVSNRPNGDMLHPSTINHIPGLYMCPVSLMRENPVCGPDMRLNIETYATCQCIDFCGLAQPSAPMRSGSRMVPALESKSGQTRYDSTRYIQVDYFAQAMAVAIVLYGVLGLVLNQFSLREQRNLAFRVIDTHPTELRILWNNLWDKLRRRKRIHSASIRPITEDSRAPSRKVQFFIAKCVATLWYGFGTLVTFLCPPTILAVMIILELDMTLLPYSEGNDAVGAWSPWVGTAFVLGAAIILHYQKSWEYSLLRWGNGLLKKLGVKAFSDTLIEEEASHESSFVAFISIPVVHTWYSIRRATNRTKLAFREFFHWFVAPMPHSQLCGCGGCVSYRAHVRTTRNKESHVEGGECTHCMSLYQKASEVSQSHERLIKNCGCRCCSFAAERSILRSQRTEKKCPCRQCNQDSKAKKRRRKAMRKAAEGPEKSTGYKTLGVRFVQMFDNQVSNMLRDPTGLAPSAWDAPEALPVPSPTTVLANNASTTPPMDIHGPLQILTDASSVSDSDSSDDLSESDVELRLLTSRDEQATEEGPS